MVLGNKGGAQDKGRGIALIFVKNSIEEDTQKCN